MSDTAKPAGEGRVLVLAPTAADEVLSRTILTQAGLTCHVCHDLACLCQELGEGADAVLLMEAVLGGDQPDCLIEVLRRQPPWSDLPVLLLTDEGPDPAVAGAALELLGNVTILERPVCVTTLVSALRAAVRARRRQYQLRDQSDILARTQEALRAREETLRPLMDRLPAGAYMCDPEGLITYFNQQALHLWGRAPKLNDPADRFCGSFKLYGTDGSPIAHDQCWMALALQTGEEYSGREVVIERPDGTRVTVLPHASPIRDEFGKLLGAFNIIVDITERKRSEQALRESEERFRVALMHTPIVVYRQDRDLRYTWIYNPKLGRSVADYLGKTDADLLSPDDSGPLTEIKRRVLDRGVGLRQEVFLHDRGKPVYYDLTVEPVWDAAGAVEGITCAAMDVTESKTLQAERDRVMERLRLQIERLPLAYILFDRNQRVLDWNPEAAKLFGFTREEMLGRVALDVIVPRPVSDHVQQIVRRISAGDMNAHSINQNRTKDGHIITCAWYNTPLLDADGSLAGVICVAQDITDRERTEEQLRETEEMFNQLATNIDGYFWLNALDDSQMYYMSPGYEKITGKSCASLYEQPESWTEIIHPEDRARVLAVVLEPPYEGMRQLEYRIVRPDGSVRWIRDRAFPVRDGTGQMYRVAGIGEDITLRKQTEERVREYHERVLALSRDFLITQEEERRHLARELHDEFGQILATITVLLHGARRLAGEAALPRLDECATLLQQAGEQVRSLALELRPTMLETLGLEATLRWLAEHHQRRTGGAVQVVGHLSGVPLPSEMAIGCFRVVQEALTNVVRHAAARHVWIELSQCERLLELEVRDDGVGFTVGSTQEQAARRGRLGLLGMAERVQLLGGSLDVKSEPGRGTRIRASFRLSDDPEGPADREE